MIGLESFESLIAESIAHRTRWSGLDATADGVWMRDQIALALRERNFGKVVITFGRNWGIDVFSILERHLSDDEYWPLLADVWSGVEWPGRQIRTISRFLRSRRGRRELMTSSVDRAAFVELPDPTPVFRGVMPRGRSGWSWTIDERIAVVFASKFHTHPSTGITCNCRGTVIEGFVEKRNAIAFLHQAHRNEAEIVADPEHVRVVRRRRPPDSEVDEVREWVRINNEKKMERLKTEIKKRAGRGATRTGSGTPPAE